MFDRYSMEIKREEAKKVVELERCYQFIEFVENTLLSGYGLSDNMEEYIIETMADRFYEVLCNAGEGNVDEWPISLSYRNDDEKYFEHLDKKMEEITRYVLKEYNLDDKTIEDMALTVRDYCYNDIWGQIFVI